MTEQTYTTGQLAEMFEVDVRRVKEWCKEGRLRCIQRRPFYLVAHSDLLVFIEKLLTIEGDSARDEVQRTRTRYRKYVRKQHELKKVQRGRE